MTLSEYMQRVLPLAALALTFVASEAGAMTLDGSLSPEIQRSAEAGVATFPAADENCPVVHFTSSEEGQGQNGIFWEAWADEFNCRVNLRPSLSGASYWTLCPIIVHEFGHLAKLTFPDNPGHPSHSSDPSNIMYPTGPFSVWPSACGPTLGVVEAKEASEHEAELREKEREVKPYLTRAFKLQSWLLARHKRELTFKSNHCRSRACRKRVSHRYRARTRKVRRELARLKAHLAAQGTSLSEHAWFG